MDAVAQHPDLEHPTEQLRFKPLADEMLLNVYRCVLLPSLTAREVGRPRVPSSSAPSA